MAIIINQPFGAGDVIFCQSIAKEFVRKGHNVIWPVMPIYAPLAKHFPQITMIDKTLINIDYNRNDEYEYNGVNVIPLRFSDSICKVPYTQCMQSKYLLMDMDWREWKRDCDIKRDIVNEFKLFKELGLDKLTGGYNLISEQFQTGGTRSFEIPKQDYDNGLPNIKMSFKEGFTLIDWLTVWENATNIFSVASSNIYLFELFSITCPIHLYVRRPNEQNHNNYSYLLTKDNYILHD